MLHWLFDPDPLTLSLIWISLLLLVSVIVSKGAGRFGIPGFLVFLAIGIAAGSGGPGGIAFADYDIAKTVGVFALIAILHSGGIGTPMADVRLVRGSGLVLASLGTVITALLVSWFSVAALGMGALPGFLLGATIACTDVAAVFTILRAKRVSLAGRLRPLLEIESALNDPMAVFLSVGALALIMHPGQNGVASLLGLIPSFFRQMIFGALAGIAGGRATAWAVRHAKLEFEGLYPALSLALMVLTYASTQSIGGSGFLAVYVSGIVLGNTPFAQRQNLAVFHDGLAWLAQIVMFLLMGLLVVPDELWPIAWTGIALSAFLVLVARPISVMVCLTPFRFSWNEQLMVAWGGLRGAVPIVLAIYPLIAGAPGARAIFHLVFVVVFISVLVQATTIPAVARWLRVGAPVQDPIAGIPAE